MKTVTAKEYTRQHGPGNTYTSTHIIMADDDIDYFVKIPPHGDKMSNFKEYVGTMLGCNFGLPVLNAFAMDLTEEFIENEPNLNDVISGSYFATKFQHNARFDIVPDMINSFTVDNTRDIPRFIVFDVFVDNTDRHEKNYLIVDCPNISETRITLIDHGHIFGGYNYPTSNHLLKYRVYKVIWNLKDTTCMQYKKTAENMVNICTLDKMDEILKDAPSHWKSSFGIQHVDEIKHMLINRNAMSIYNAIVDSEKIQKSILGVS